MKLIKLVALGATALAFAAPSMAANLSFLGNVTGPNDVLLFDFNVGSSSTVTLRSYSYAGGTNAQGQVIASGGFDPILTLYNNLGQKIYEQDDAVFGTVPTDPNTGSAYDVLFQQLLSAGSYTVALSAYSNFCSENLAQGCSNNGNLYGRDTHFAFDILNVDTAIQTGGGEVPEPAMLGLFGLGAIGLGFARRRRA